MARTPSLEWAASDGGKAGGALALVRPLGYTRAI